MEPYGLTSVVHPKCTWRIQGFDFSIFFHYTGIMKLTKKEVEHIAQLARLRLDDREIEKFANQLSSILDYVSQLQEVPTENISETVQVTGLENISRSDVVEQCDTKTIANILKNTPELEDNLMKTKSVFE